MFFIFRSVELQFGAGCNAPQARLVERHLHAVSVKGPRPALSPRKAVAHRMAMPFRGWPFRSG
jgi:hypothetical protein